jgi:hypothetical protein
MNYSKDVSIEEIRNVLRHTSNACNRLEGMLWNGPFKLTAEVREAEIKRIDDACRHLNSALSVLAGNPTQ